MRGSLSDKHFYCKKKPHHFLSFSTYNQIKTIKVMWPWNRVFTKYDYILCLSGKRLDRDVWKVFWRQSNNPSAIQAKVGFFPLNYFRRFPLKSVRALTSFGIQFYRDGNICSVGIALFKGLFGDLRTDHVQWRILEWTDLRLIKYSCQVLNRPCVTIITNAGSTIILVYSVNFKQLFCPKKTRTESN